MSDEKIGDCHWQGYGFGAPYEDAGCCQGKACDLDSGDAPGRVALGEENCPQCNGTGVPVDGSRGPMALLRTRARSELQELLVEIKDTELLEMIVGNVNRLFKLIRELEEG